MTAAVTRVSWTPALDAALRTAFAAGGCRVAAEALGLRTSQVKNRVHQLGLKRSLRFWTEAEDAVLRAEYPAGATAEELARKLGRTLPATKRRVYLLGLESGRMWAAEAVEAVRARYATDGAAALARELLGADGEHEVWRVYNLAFRLGVTQPVRLTDELFARVRELHAAGLNDRRAAEVLVAEGLIDARNAREKVTAVRSRRLKLPRVEQTHAERVAMGRAGRLKQMATGKNPRDEAYRRLALRYGLPEDTPPRAVEILVAMATGPKTRAELIEVTGKNPGDVWNALRVGYVSGLIRRGLVARAGTRKRPTYFLTPAAIDLLSSKGEGGGCAHT